MLTEVKNPHGPQVDIQKHKISQAIGKKERKKESAFSKLDIRN